MSLCDEKGCFATRRVTSSREALFKTFEKCDFVTISVALRREGLLCNEKSDFVTISVVTPSNLREVSLRDGKCCFATRRVTSSREVVVKYLKPSRRLCRHFSQASPALPAVFQTALLAGFTGTSQMLCVLPSASPTLLGGL